jgi:hypothetical protein
LHAHCLNDGIADVLAQAGDICAILFAVQLYEVDDAFAAKRGDFVKPGVYKNADRRYAPVERAL